MRLAYFISLHHKPYQFEWLLNALYNPTDIFLVHIDLKTLSGLKRERRGVWSRTRELLADKPNIRLMRPRFSNWGGWSLSHLGLAAIDLLLRHEADWTHFINLSGQCYPTKSGSEIRQVIGDAGEKQFVELRPFATLPADDWHHRRALMIETPLRAFSLPITRQPPRDIDVNHKGAQWVILTRAFCEWQRTAAVRKELCRYLAFTHLSDELLFQGLLLNGPFREQVVADYGRTIQWPGPKTFTSEDWEYLARAPGIFGRKFDAKLDCEILLRLAEHGEFRPGPIFTR